MAWMRMHMRYRIVDTLRQHDRRSVPTAPDLLTALTDAQRAAAAAPEVAIGTLMAALARLPEDQRRLLVGNLCGVRAAELQRQLQLSRHAYNGRRRRALERLRQELAAI